MTKAIKVGDDWQSVETAGGDHRFYKKKADPENVCKAGNKGYS